MILSTFKTRPIYINNLLIKYPITELWPLSPFHASEFTTHMLKSVIALCFQICLELSYRTTEVLLLSWSLSVHVLYFTNTNLSECSLAWVIFQPTRYKVKEAKNKLLKTNGIRVLFLRSPICLTLLEPISTSSVSPLRYLWTDKQPENCSVRHFNNRLFEEFILG